MHILFRYSFLLNVIFWCQNMKKHTFIALDNDRKKNAKRLRGCLLWSRNESFYLQMIMFNSSKISRVQLKIPDLHVYNVKKVIVAIWKWQILITLCITLFSFKSSNKNSRGISRLVIRKTFIWSDVWRRELCADLCRTGFLDKHGRVPVHGDGCSEVSWINAYFMHICMMSAWQCNIYSYNKNQN